MYPVHRQRRLRETAPLRQLVQETRLSMDDVVYPMFVRPGKDQAVEISSMPGQRQLSADRAAKLARELYGQGLRAVLLFGIPSRKDPFGRSATDEAGPVQESIRSVKDAVPEMVVITDVCLCEYTDHGHCGILDGERIANDETLEHLSAMAISHAAAGADIVAPSDMMDGRVGSIRAALDQSGFTHTPILSYAVKYASAFYGPFREAAQSAPAFGDRRSHQMDPHNGKEAEREALFDLEEGADLLMVKPAMPYLDVLARVRAIAPVPVWAYQVSGEYAMLHAAAAAGAFELERAALESLIGIRRAGADRIVTYFAPELPAWLPD